MARSGQINKLAAQIKDALEDGIESTGAICTDGSPAYGGTGTGEDFADFTIYSIDIGDAEDDDMIEELPCIAFKCERAPVEYTLDNRFFYQSDITFEIRISFHHDKTIDSTSHQYSELVNWYIERLQYIMDILQLTVVNVSAGPYNTGSMNMGRVDSEFGEEGMVYVGQTFATVQFLQEV